MKRDEIEKKIEEYLHERIPGQQALNGQTKLFSDGLLESVEFVRLVDFLESSFHIRLAGENLSLSSFDQVNDIVDVCERLLNK